MENFVALAVVVILASLIGIWSRSNQGSIKSAKLHPNFSLDYSQFGQMGKKATLVQFSTQFCSICPASKEILTEISNNQTGVEFIEIDAEENLHLTKKLSILSTPTVLIIDELGEEVARFSGRPNKIKIVKFINENIPTSNVEKV